MNWALPTRDVDAVTSSRHSGIPRRRWWRRPAVILLVILALGAAASATRRADSSSPLVREAGAREGPSFALPGLVDEGDVVRLSDHRGSPVVLNFWASWCAPCRREMPALAQVSSELDGRVKFIGIDHQDLRDEALDLLQETGVRYPTAFDPSGSAAQDYELRGMPTTVFIDSEGRVLATSLGELTESELRTSILELFDVAAK